MKRLSVIIHTMCAALAATWLVSCNPVGPDQSVWQDVSAFSWPLTDGVSMQYSVDDEKDTYDDVYDMVVQPGTDALPGGRQMAKMLWTTRRSGKAVSAQFQLQYLATRDTLFTLNNSAPSELRATFALVGPLEKGRTWIASYSDRKPDSATVRATIVERYNYWKVEGKGYNNVVAVRYELLGQPAREEFIRFYAEGIGEILTVHNKYPISNYQTEAPPLEVGRMVLLHTSASQQ